MKMRTKSKVKLIIDKFYDDQYKFNLTALMLVKIVCVHLLTSFPADVLREVREEAEKYGPVTDIKSKGGHAYVEFQEASDCQRAVVALTGTTFEQRTLLAVFYPISLWCQNVLLV